MKFKNILSVILCIFLFPALSGCSNMEKSEKNIFAMDTVMNIKIYGDGANELTEDAEKEINRLDKLLDRKDESGEIYALNKNGSLDAGHDTKYLIQKALEMSAMTGGAFDITIAPLMDLWGFYTKEYHVPTQEELQRELKKVNYNNITLSGDRVTISKGAQIDLGGIAKGYLSGKLADYFRQCGVKYAIISLGGNVEAIGTKPDGEKWTVAIQHPNSEGFIGTLKVSDRAVITSGGYQRYFEKDGKVYHHIIDPKTGISAQSGIKSATVVSSDSAGADALSTALFVMGLEKSREFLKEHKEYDAVIMTEDNKVYITEGIKDGWQSEYGYETV